MLAHYCFKNSSFSLCVRINLFSGSLFCVASTNSDSLGVVVSMIINCLPVGEFNSPLIPVAYRGSFPWMFFSPVSEGSSCVTLGTPLVSTASFPVISHVSFLVLLSSSTFVDILSYGISFPTNSNSVSNWVAMTTKFRGFSHILSQKKKKSNPFHEDLVAEVFMQVNVDKDSHILPERSI